MKTLIISVILAIVANTARGQVQCTQTTNKGTQCSRKAVKGQMFCSQHNPNAVRCADTTKSGKACKMLPIKGSKYCHIHNK